MRHFANFSSFVVSFYVVCLHFHVLLAAAFVASLVPGLSDGCVALDQLVPMGCLVKEDGSVVTWGFCVSRWVVL